MYMKPLTYRMYKFIDADNDTYYCYKGYDIKCWHADNFLGYYSFKDYGYYILLGTKKLSARNFTSYINNYKRSYYYL